MGELTSTVDDKEILQHFTDVIAPFVQKHQCLDKKERNVNYPSCSKTKTEAINEIDSMLTTSVRGKRSQDETNLKLHFIKTKFPVNLNI